MAIMVPNPPSIPTPPVISPGPDVLSQRLLRLVVGGSFITLPNPTDYDGTRVSHNSSDGNDGQGSTTCEFRPARSSRGAEGGPRFSLRLVVAGRTRDECLGQTAYWTAILKAGQYLWEGQTYYLKFSGKVLELSSEPQRGGLSMHIEITYEVDALLSSWYMPLVI